MCRSYRAKYKGKIVGLEMIVHALVFLQIKQSQLVEAWQYLKNMLIKRGYWKSRFVRNISTITSMLVQNFRMTNMQASIGVAQLNIIDKLLKIRKKYLKSNSYFCNYSYLTLIPNNNWSENSYWLYTLIINNIGQKKDKLISIMQTRIECRPGFYSLNKMRPFKILKR